MTFRSEKSRQGGKGTVRRDRTGETYAGLVVLGPAPRKDGEMAWSCRCVACGSLFVRASSRMSRSEKLGMGCGCRMGANVKTTRAA